MTIPALPRICYITSPEFFSQGAYAVHAMEMCKAMDRMNIQFEAVVPGGFEEKDIFEYYGVKKPFKLRSLPFTKHKGRQIAHGIAAAVYALANRKNFDLVLTRNIVCAAVVAKTGKLPAVYDAHHPPVNFAARALFKWFQNCRGLRAVSFNSEGLRRIYLQYGINSGKTVAAHNGVETQAFENRPPAGEIRKRLGLPPDKKIVCYCGNTYQGRGIEKLVEAAGEIKDALFLVVGGTAGDNAPHIEAARKKGFSNFIVKGFVPHAEVADHLLASDVLALPYTREVSIKGGTKAAEFTSPIKLFEYMAAGKPIVATVVPSVLEVLNDGEDSVIVSPDGAKQFTGAVRRCLEDTDFSGKIARNAREKSREYGWENRVSKILSFACGEQTATKERK